MFLANLLHTLFIGNVGSCQVGFGLCFTFADVHVRAYD